MAEQTFHESIIEEFRANGGVVTVIPFPKTCDSGVILSLRASRRHEPPAG